MQNRKIAVGLGSLATFPAFAAVDTAAVGTALTSAVSSAETVGGFVIAGVAALVVVGLIISVVRKL